MTRTISGAYKGNGRQRPTTLVPIRDREQVVHDNGVDVIDAPPTRHDE